MRSSDEEDEDGHTMEKHYETFGLKRQMPTVEVIYVRHGRSCSNLISRYTPKEDKWKKLKHYLDPELSSRGIEEMKLVPVPDVDYVMCSTMLRAQETALYLYPDDPMILCVPFVKEKGTIAENTVGSRPQHPSERIDYRYVSPDGGRSWTKDAHEISLGKWFAWLGQWVKQLGKDVRILVVTHSRTLRHLFPRAEDRPRNVCMVMQRYTVDKHGLRPAQDNPEVKRFREAGPAVLFTGVKAPDKLSQGDIGRCVIKAI